MSNNIEMLSKFLEKPKQHPMIRYINLEIDKLTECIDSEDLVFLTYSEDLYRSLRR